MPRGKRASSSDDQRSMACTKRGRCANRDILAKPAFFAEDVFAEVVLIAASSVSVMARAGRVAAAPREHQRAMPFSG
jgi:hypothetical protein